MERTGNVELNDLLSSGFCEQGHCLYDRFLLTGNNDLAGAVEIGRPASADLLSYGFDSLDIKTDNCCHRTFACRDFGRHELSSDPRKPYRVFEAHGACIRLNACKKQRVCDDAACRNQRGLCVFSDINFFVGLEKEFLHVDSGSL